MQLAAAPHMGRRTPVAGRRGWPIGRGRGLGRSAHVGGQKLCRFVRNLHVFCICWRTPGAGVGRSDCPSHPIGPPAAQRSRADRPMGWNAPNFPTLPPCRSPSSRPPAGFRRLAQQSRLRRRRRSRRPHLRLRLRRRRRPRRPRRTSPSPAPPRCACSTSSARPTAWAASAPTVSSRPPRRATPATWSRGGFFSHVSPTGSTLEQRIRQGTRYLAGALRYEIGENIAWGQGALAKPSAIVAAWMASPATAPTSSAAPSARSASASPPAPRSPAWPAIPQ